MDAQVALQAASELSLYYRRFRILYDGEKTGPEEPTFYFVSLTIDDARHWMSKLPPKQQENGIAMGLNHLSQVNNKPANRTLLMDPFTIVALIDAMFVAHQEQEKARTHAEVQLDRATQVIQLLVKKTQKLAVQEAELGFARGLLVYYEEHAYDVSLGEAWRRWRSRRRRRREEQRLKQNPPWSRKEEPNESVDRAAESSPGTAPTGSEDLRG